MVLLDQEIHISKAYQLHMPFTSMIRLILPKEGLSVFTSCRAKEIIKHGICVSSIVSYLLLV